jgi:hypothetical protein
MIICLIARYVWKPVASAVAVASLASLALVQGVEPASAKPTKCQVRHSHCTERCMCRSYSENSTDKANHCISRTCDHQFRACARDSGESTDPNHGYDRPRGGKPGKGGGNREAASSGPASQPARPLGGGILESGTGMTQQCPAATGSPSAPAAAPQVIIR